MAAKQQHGDGLTSELAGLSKSQLYDVMCQVKALIEKNHQQAREILIANPLLTRSLFQAQIMLGMVKPPQAMPNIQVASSQTQMAQTAPAPNIPATQSLPVQVGILGLSGSGSSKPSLLGREQYPTQPSISVPPPAVPPLTLQSQTTLAPPSVAQTKNFLNVQVPSMPPPQSSQIPNLSLPAPAPPHYSVLPPNMPMVSGQPQQSLQQPPLQIPGIFNQPLQQPMPQQPRPPSMQTFPHHLQPQMPHSLGFQQPSAPQPLISQPLFHPGLAPSSYPLGQPPMPSQPPPQQLYQGGSHIGPDYGNQAGSSMQVERGAPWAPGLLEMTSVNQLPGPPQMIGGQMAPSTVGQPPRPPALTPEMEKALLQQIMSLTPEQISLLPPEQRHQVLQLQEMLR